MIHGSLKAIHEPLVEHTKMMIKHSTNYTYNNFDTTLIKHMDGVRDGHIDLVDACGWYLHMVELVDSKEKRTVFYTNPSDSELFIHDWSKNQINAQVGFLFCEEKRLTHVHSNYDQARHIYGAHLAHLNNFQQCPFLLLLLLLPFLELEEWPNSDSFLFSISHITRMSSYSHALTSCLSFSNPFLRMPRRVATTNQTLRTGYIMFCHHSTRRETSISSIMLTMR